MTAFTLLMKSFLCWSLSSCQNPSRMVTPITINTNRVDHLQEGENINLIVLFMIDEDYDAISVFESFLIGQAARL